MKIIICLSVEGPPGRYIVPGSKEEDCSDCGTRIYISPSGYAAREGNILVCLDCALSRIEKDDWPIMDTLPGQAEEVLEYFKRN